MRLLAGCALVAGLATACSAGGSSQPTASTSAPATPAPSTAPVSSEPPPPLAGAVTVDVSYIPNLALLRSLEIAVADGGDADATITDIGFRSPLFASVPSHDVGTVVDAGRTRDLALALGDATCPPASGPSVVDIAVDVGGVAAAASYPVPDADRLVELNARECGQRAVLAAADIRFGPHHPIVDDVMAATIEVTRRGSDEPITVTDVGGTLLFSVRPRGPHGALATMESGEQTATVEIGVEVHRCDAHTVSQSQISYRFPVWVAVGERETQYIVLEPDPSLRAALEQLVHACLEREAGG